MATYGFCENKCKNEVYTKKETQEQLAGLAAQKSNKSTCQYFTEEQWAGSWKDGNLYRKIVEVTVPTTSANGTSVTGTTTIASDIKYAFIEFSNVILNNGQQYPIPYTSSEGSSIKANITADKELQITNSSTTFNEKTAYFSILYTKTTD